jgi:undecaprenyl diphosphate synthase
MSDAQYDAPVHLGIILDGNRRWAREHSLPTVKGHKKGYENLKNIAKYAFDRGAKYVSAFVFSTENWNRSTEEVDYLMKLLLWVAKNEVKELNKHNIRVRFLGEEERLNAKVLEAMRNVEELTKDNTAGTLLLCLNYGGQQEIASAVNAALARSPGLTKITPELIEEHLYGADIPAADLIIRTSGEQRLSNFMLWRAAYSELYFSDKNWPAFDEDDMQQALDNFSKRSRRFGK